MLTSLSISSSNMTGLLTPTVFKPWMIRPGIAPMYVRRWPLMSDWLQVPPRDMLHQPTVDKTGLRYAHFTCINTDRHKYYKKCSLLEDNEKM
jgi:hypothetical protein